MCEQYSDLELADQCFALHYILIKVTSTWGILALEVQGKQQDITIDHDIIMVILVTMFT